MKEIWFINQAAGSPYHGMVFRTYYLAREMVKAGHRVTVFSGSFNHNFFKLPSVDGRFTNETIDGINYVWVKLPHYPQSKSVGRILSMFIFPFKLFAFPRTTRPDAIIVSSPPLTGILIGWIWAKFTGAKLFFEVRDIWPLSIQSLGGYSSSHPFIFLLSAIEKFAYRVSDYVTSVLPKSYLHFEQKGMLPHKFFYVPNGIVEEDRTLPISETFQRLKKMKQDGDLIVGYAGTIGIANNLEVFARAQNLINDEKFKFVIVGEGALKVDLKNKFPKIQFFNAVSKKEVLSVIELFDVAYVGLKREPLFKFGISPNKIFDYMFCRVPIIMAIDSGNDLVSEAQCGESVPSCKEHDVAAALQRLLSLSPEKRRELGQNGYDFVSIHHSYDKIAQKYLDRIP
jgi:glycosyltransferase involved in cell wall biosynthesis